MRYHQYMGLDKACLLNALENVRASRYMDKKEREAFIIFELALSRGD